MAKIRQGLNIFVPDGVDSGSALARTTHLGIGAHPDDIEIMAAAPIAECYEIEDGWFSGICGPHRFIPLTFWNNTLLAGLPGTTRVRPEQLAVKLA